MARADDPSKELPRDLVAKPQISLTGSVGQDTLQAFRDQLATAEEGEGSIALELTTSGGDAEMGRRMALEVRLARERLGRRLIFIGKTEVYSAGVTIMSGFPPEDRYLTADTQLLIHCRKLEKELQLEGPLKASRIRVQQLISEIDASLELEREGYDDLIRGSDVTFEEVEEKAEKGWYLRADEALARRLIAGVV
ncbi:MAG TPA: peptidase S14 [Allosphingosinicella sp.]|uniref:peptidase S14 n=1 Tax=Allosphingosinicella sp. TaxID=2823234 RepID=UPI002ED9A3F8